MTTTVYIGGEAFAASDVEYSDGLASEPSATTEPAGSPVFACEFTVQWADVDPAVRRFFGWRKTHRRSLPAFVRLSRARERAKERRAIMRAHLEADKERIRDRSWIHYESGEYASVVGIWGAFCIWTSEKRRRSRHVDVQWSFAPETDSLEDSR